MKKYIILALVALLAAVLFVACDNDVKVDNNTAYTEVLESEGAFVVNGKAYDTLQSAIQAAVGGKSMADPVVITMTRNVTSRPVVIPEDSEIELDLGGYKLTFIDVEENAFFVGDAYFVLANGTVALLDETAELRLICAENNAYVTLSDVISTTGCVDITESRLAVNCYLNDVRMNNSTIYVARSGHVVLTSIVGDNNHFVVTDPDTAITNETEVDIDDVVESGVCYIERKEGVSYYGSLQAALNDLDADNLTIIFRDNYDESELAVEAGAGRPVIIDLNGYNVTVASITADAALTIVNSNVPNLPAASATFKGNITAAGTFLVNCNADEEVLAEGKVVINGAVTAGGLGIGAFNAEFKGAIETTGRVEVVGCTVKGSVTADGDICMVSVSFIENSDNNIYAKKGGKISITNCTGTVGDIVATNVAGSEPGTITIDNRNGVLWTFNLIAADEAETKFGDIAIFTENVERVEVLGSVTGAAVTAGSSANNSEEMGATFHRSIAATGLISISNSFVSPMDDLIISTSAEDEDGVPAISMTNVRLNWMNQNVEIYVEIEATAGGSISLDTCRGYASNVTSLKSVTISGSSELEVNRISTKDLTVYSAAGLYADHVEANGVVEIDSGRYGSVEITGSGDSRISGGEFGYYDSLFYGNFTYNGTGTLDITGGSFNGTTKFLRGSSIVLNGSSLYFGDIDAVTDNVDIKYARIDEDSLADVEKIVNRINQDSVLVEAQQVYINYIPSGIVNLTGVDKVFNMTSANIQSAESATLNYTMYETNVYDTDNVVTSGLIVGSYGSTPASATFNYNNGSGRPQLVVTGKIGLLAGGNVIYSTQLNDDHTERPNNNLVYGCTYELVDDNGTETITDDDVYGYVIRDDVYGVGSMGYYEYRYNGN